MLSVSLTPRRFMIWTLRILVCRQNLIPSVPHVGRLSVRYQELRMGNRMTENDEVGMRLCVYWGQNGGMQPMRAMCMVHSWPNIQLVGNYFHLANQYRLWIWAFFRVVKHHRVVGAVLSGWVYCDEMRRSLGVV